MYCSGTVVTGAWKWNHIFDHTSMWINIGFIIFYFKRFLDTIAFVRESETETWGLQDVAHSCHAVHACRNVCDGFLISVRKLGVPYLLMRESQLVFNDLKYFADSIRRHIIPPSARNFLRSHAYYVSKCRNVLWSKTARVVSLYCSTHGMSMHISIV